MTTTTEPEPDLVPVFDAEGRPLGRVPRRVLAGDDGDGRRSPVPQRRHADDYDELGY